MYIYRDSALKHMRPRHIGRIIDHSIDKDETDTLARNKKCLENARFSRLPRTQINKAYCACVDVCVSSQCHLRQIRQIIGEKL